MLTVKHIYSYPIMPLSNINLSDMPMFRQFIIKSGRIPVKLEDGSKIGWAFLKLPRPGEARNLLADFLLTVSVDEIKSLTPTLDENVSELKEVVLRHQDNGYYSSTVHVERHVLLNSPECSCGAWATEFPMQHFDYCDVHGTPYTP